MQKTQLTHSEQTNCLADYKILLKANMDSTTTFYHFTRIFQLIDFFLFSGSPARIRGTLRTRAPVSWWLHLSCTSLVARVAAAVALYYYPRWNHTYLAMFITSSCSVTIIVDIRVETSNQTFMLSCPEIQCIPMPLGHCCDSRVVDLRIILLHDSRHPHHHVMCWPISCLQWNYVDS